MAVGDVVNGIGALGAGLDFQPAAGVECLISYVSDEGAPFQLFNGVNGSRQTGYINAGIIGNPLKLFITNSIYLRIVALAGVRAGYSGITIK